VQLGSDISLLAAWKVELLLDKKNTPAFARALIEKECKPTSHLQSLIVPFLSD